MKVFALLLLIGAAFSIIAAMSFVELRGCESYGYDFEVDSWCYNLDNDERELLQRLKLSDPSVNLDDDWLAIIPLGVFFIYGMLLLEYSEWLD